MIGILLWLGDLLDGIDIKMVWILLVVMVWKWNCLEIGWFSGMNLVGLKLFVLKIRDWIDLLVFWLIFEKNWLNLFVIFLLFLLNDLCWLYDLDGMYICIVF